MEMALYLLDDLLHAYSYITDAQGMPLHSVTDTISLGPIFQVSHDMSLGHVYHITQHST